MKPYALKSATLSNGETMLMGTQNVLWRVELTEFVAMRELVGARVADLVNKIHKTGPSTENTQELAFMMKLLSEMEGGE